MLGSSSNADAFCSSRPSLSDTFDDLLGTNTTTTGGKSDRRPPIKVKKSSRSAEPFIAFTTPDHKYKTTTTTTTTHDSSSPVVAGQNQTSQQQETVEEAIISLKVAVEKKKNRVVFAESNSDFVDVIFSFITLPIGSILGILQEKSHAFVIGCTNNLYKSVCDLDKRLFRTEACKEMLLHPKRLSETQCRKLKLQYDENLKTPKCFSVCGNLKCRKLSEFPNAHCHCGQLMDQPATLSEQAGNVTCDEDGGVFVKGGFKSFLINDNMQVEPGSSSLSIKLLKELGITNANELETQSVIVGPERVMQLLGLSLVSGTPLTHWILSEQNSPPVPTKAEPESSSEISDARSETNDSFVIIVNQESSTKTSDDPLITKLEKDSSIETLDEPSEKNEPKKMRLDLFISKSQNTVLYAECEEDFVDFLFSFLTFPLGSILKLLDGNSQLRNFDNPYRSVTEPGINEHMKSKQLEDMLLCPKLAPYVACDNQLLQIEEGCHPQYEVCPTNGDSNIKRVIQPASAANKDSVLGIKINLLSVIDPTSPTRESKRGGGFVKGPAKFMVTDDLTVTQLSPIESIAFIAKSNVPVTDVDEMSVEVGVEEGKCLLRAALISKTALTDVFRKHINI